MAAWHIASQKPGLACMSAQGVCFSSLPCVCCEVPLDKAVSMLSLCCVPTFGSVVLQLGLQGQAGLGRPAGTPGGDLTHLSAQEVEQLALLRQLQLNGSLQANLGNANAPAVPGVFGSVSSAPGASFRAPSPLAVGGHRTTSPAFGNHFGGGTVSPAYSTTSLPGVLGLQSRPGSAFGQTAIGGGATAADPVIRRPSPTTSIASHASKQGGVSAVWICQQTAPCHCQVPFVIQGLGQISGPAGPG